MFRNLKTAGLAAAALGCAILFVASAGPNLSAQGFGQGMRRGMMGDPSHQADMQLLHALFDHRDRITRQITLQPDGVSTLTESNDPKVARLIQSHVESMSARVKDGRPIHQRDPLFREIFTRADAIIMTYDKTPRGVRVIETSTDPCVVQLVQAHAEVVSAFIANGQSEAMKNHPVPEACR